jgi:hypothetical protein
VLVFSAVFAPQHSATHEMDEEATAGRAGATGTAGAAKSSSSSKGGITFSAIWIPPLSFFLFVSFVLCLHFSGSDLHYL